MSAAAAPQASIPVGVVIERRKATSPWADFLWRPVSVLHGEPQAQPWTVLGEEGGVITFYAGRATVTLYRSETGLYRDNLVSGAPALWVALASTGADPPYLIAAVTVDPAEGEALSETAATIVEQVPMPESIQRIVAAFVTEHHVERPFVKRARDRADSEALARHGDGERDE